MRTIQILNLPISNISLSELLAAVKHGGVIFTPNVDHLVKLQSDREFYQAYQTATYCLCDSQVLVYAARFLGTPIQEKISGSDFFPAFYRHYQQDDTIRIFLLGSRPGVAERARQRINGKVGRNMVVAAHSPSFGFEQDPAECQAIVEQINQSGATVLAVGVGAPKQEKWIQQYRNQLTNIEIFMGIGATIDFEAGELRRAPQWMSQSGLEWLYRLMSEPQRLWKRYLIDDSVFLGLLLRQKLHLYCNPFVAQSYDSERVLSPELASVSNRH